MSGLRERVIAAIKAAGKEPRSYSGRGMCGECCVGMKLQQYEPVPDGLPGGYSQDSLGLGRILYWRSAPWSPKEA